MVNRKTAILLINLGTPDSPSTKDVRKYLFQFLNDPRVIENWFVRNIVMNLFVVPLRSPKSAKVYKELFDLNGGKSPLLTHGIELRDKLNAAINNDNVTVDLAMRYGQPSIESVLTKIKTTNPDEIIIVPLYPQYASASTGSCIEEAFRVINSWWTIPDIKMISQFYDNPGYINTIVDIAQKYPHEQYDHVLFSYHGLPISQVDKVYDDNLCEDKNCELEITQTNKFCYKATCYANTRMVAQRLGIPEDKYTVCFQSRLTKKWIEPFADEVVIERAKKGDKKILCFSLAFVADCLETTIEIGEEYQELFEEHGGEKVQLVESLNTHPMWVDTLKEMVLNEMS